MDIWKYKAFCGCSKIFRFFQIMCTFARTKKIYFPVVFCFCSALFLSSYIFYYFLCVCVFMYACKPSWAHRQKLIYIQLIWDDLDPWIWLGFEIHLSLFCSTQLKYFCYSALLCSLFNNCFFFSSLFCFFLSFFFFSSNPKATEKLLL